MTRNSWSATFLRKLRKRPAAVACTILTVALVVAVSLVSLAWAGPSFPDVSPSNPYYTAILDLAGRGIVTGYPTGDFGPADPVQRQQFAKMIVLTAGYPVSEANVCPFTDVPVSGPADLYPDNYIAVAAQHGITLGKTPTSFDPYSYISRYQLITMVVRAAEDLQPGLLKAVPSNWVGSSGWQDDPVHGTNAAKAEYNGLLAGITLSGLSPYGNMTRGEVAQVLHNLLTELAPTTTTTTTPPGSSTTVAVSTTTTASTTTTTVPPTTSSTVAASTTTTTAFVPKTDYAIAGLEINTLSVKVLDQFGRGMPNVNVYLNSTILEGSNLAALTNVLVGATDGNGYVAYTWGQSAAGAWGVEQVFVTVDNGTPAGLTWKADTVQWIYNDAAAGPDIIMAANGQQKVNVVSGFAEWNGKTLRAYLNPGGSSLGSAVYVSSAALAISTNLHTWVTGEGFFVGAQSTNDDGVRNWVYNIVL
jgi:hypothetical protein